MCLVTYYVDPQRLSVLSGDVIGIDDVDDITIATGDLILHKRIQKRYGWCWQIVKPPTTSSKRGSVKTCHVSPGRVVR